jgi:hypothetical protein
MFTYVCKADITPRLKLNIYVGLYNHFELRWNAGASLFSLTLMILPCKLTLVMLYCGST